MSAHNVARPARGYYRATRVASVWLVEFLQANGGVARSEAIKTAGNAAGIKTTTLVRARRAAGVLAVSGGFPRCTAWCLDESTLDLALDLCRKGR